MTMTQHIDEFADEVRVAITTFVDDYKLQHKAKPGQFPLELGDENKGLWWEFFMLFAVDKED